MPKLPCIHILVCALLGSALSLQAQPFLVEDIRTGELPAEWPSEPEFVDLGGVAFFTAFDRIHGTELWRSDGTPGGTSLVRDVCPGLCSSSITKLTVAGAAVFFQADDGAHGPALWKSDGTEAGTALVREGEPFALAEVNGLLAFAATSPAQGQELWRSDGTAAGTFSLGDLRPGAVGSVPQPLGQVGSLLLFRADDGVNGRELWKTDGTVAGTAFVEDILPGPDSAFPLSSTKEGSAVAGEKLVFRAFFESGPDGYKLWGSDGTAAGTGQVKDVMPVSDLGTADVRFVKLGDVVFFSSGGLWKTDGTEAGTVHVASPGSGNASELTVAGNRIFFKTASGFFPDAKLYVSDGTEAGTVQVPLAASLVDYGSNGFGALGDNLVFFAGINFSSEPWTSDGTEAGTFPLADVQRQGGSKVIGGLWLFRADTLNGIELWKSDGTPAGTELLKRIDQSDASGLMPEIEAVDAFFPKLPLKADLAGTLLFAADDGSMGTELWRSDGTGTGTWLLKDLYPSGSGFPHDLTPFGGKIYFAAFAGEGFWSSDGTEAGTASFPSYCSNDLTAAGEQLFCVASSIADQLRKIGPSDPDTTLVKTLFPGIMQNLTAVGSRLFLTALGGLEGSGLWTSDGTEAGTRFVSDRVPVRELTAHLGTLFFSANDVPGGQELWKSNGTTAGTSQVKDIRPGSASSNPREITSAGSLLFFVADDGAAGAELWRSNGTAAGTVRVKDIRPGSDSSFIQGMTAHGSRVFFGANDGVHGHELWVSDGTEAGTQMIEDAIPGEGSSYPRYLTVAGHLLLFAAEDGTHGLEPWKSDGTAAGTAMIYDVAPGATPSTPTGFTLSGDYLYFTANDGTRGFELWALDRAALGSTLAATKRVMSPTYPGGTVTYEIVITNTGAGPHPDNSGDEMGDTLPAGLTLTGASADTGAATLDLPNNRVSWNGALDPGESATVLVHATLSPSAAVYSMIFNQAAVNYDSDGDGTLEKTGVSSDPGRGLEEPTLATVSTPPLDFHTITPCRVLDTRASSPLASGVKETFAIAGTCGIPPTAKAVSANLTAVGATGSGHLVLHPAGIPHSVPITSSVSFKAVRALANNAALPLASGAVDATATVAGGGTVHLVLDVNGYYE